MPLVEFPSLYKIVIEQFARALTADHPYGNISPERGYISCPSFTPPLFCARAFRSTPGNSLVSIHIMTLGTLRLGYSRTRISSAIRATGRSVTGLPSW